MATVGTANDDGCRICCVPPLKRRRGRYPTVTVTVMMLLMMFYCFIRAATAAAHQPKTVAMAADDAVVWTPSAFVVNAASLSAFSDRSPENVGHGQLASLPRRDESSGRDRHGSMTWRALIAVGPVGLDGAVRRSTALARPEIVNNSKPPATTTATAAGMDTPKTAAATVNVAPVITTPLGRHDRLPRIQIKSNLPCTRSLFSALYASFQQPDDRRLLPASAPCSLIMKTNVANSVEQLNNDIYAVQSKLTPPGRNDSDNKYTVTSTVMDRPNIFSDISAKDAELEPPGVGRVHRHRRRQRGAESVDEVDQQMLSSGSGSLLNAVTTSTDGTSTETSVVRLKTPKTDEQVGVSLRAAALRYRSRGNFAALVDPLKSGRASASASANKWRQLGTVGDNSTSPPAVTEETTSSSITSSRSIFINDSDSIEVNVIMAVRVDVNDSTHVPGSVSVATEPLSDSFPLNRSKALNSSLVTSGEWNCSKATKSLSLQAALKLRLSASAVALCVYTLSFLYTLIAAWSITSIVFSLCIIRNQHWSLLVGRRWYSQLVLGFVAMAAAARALYYVAAEYHLLAAMATPASQRMIYDCWLPFIIAAFFFHLRLLRVKAVTKENEEAQHVGFCRELCAVILALCFCLALVVLLCLLIEFCILPVLSVFVLRFAFALYAVLLSVANVYRIATSSGRCISTQVVFCPLFVICAGFFIVDAATLLSSEFALLFQKNAVVLIAVKAADRLAELFISALLCAHSSSMVFRFQRKNDQKGVNVGQKEVRGTKIDEDKMVNYYQASVLSTTTIKPQKTRRSWLNRLLDATSKKSKVVDVGSVESQISLGVVHSLCWASTEDPAIVHGVSPLPPSSPSRVTRSRSMLYNDHGFIRFRLDGDTDGESDARTLDDDDGGPGQARSLPASEYASADDLSLRRGPSSAGTPRWSRPGSPSLTGFRAPSIHLQDSIDRALDRCDIWRVGCEQGQLNVDELHRIVQLYADGRRGNRQRRAAGKKSISYAEV